MDKKGGCALAKGFSLYEKLYAQISFFTFSILGLVGIYMEDWRWSLAYFIILLGVPFIVQRYLVCPRCPHLYEYGDCLQLHPKLTMLLIKERKTSPMTRLDKGVWLIIFFLLPVFPLYWLAIHPWLLILFLATCIMWYAGQLFYFCKRCRVKDCPFNRTKNMVAH